jgi:hypothetical protein
VVYVKALQQVDALGRRRAEITPGRTAEVPLAVNESLDSLCVELLTRVRIHAGEPHISVELSLPVS